MKKEKKGKSRARSFDICFEVIVRDRSKGDVNAAFLLFNGS